LRKETEIDQATKAGLDIQELEKQKGRLQFEIANLQSDLEAEARAENVRKQFRKAAGGLVNILSAIELINDRIMNDPVFCRLTADEIALFRSDIYRINEATGQAMTLADELLQKFQKEAGLHVV
jgi:hypothetical protein